MSEMSKDEMNRECAETLGWKLKPFKGARTVFAEDDEWCTQPINEKYEIELWHRPECDCPPNIITNQACIKGDPPDFFTSESANAMLLEAGHIAVAPIKTMNATWVWSAAPYENMRLMKQDPDRKTCIILAFLTWVEAGGKVK